MEPTKWPRRLKLALLALTAMLGAAALGFWAGFETSLHVSGNLLYQATISRTEAHRTDLARLDAGQFDLLRESLNLELASGVRILCADSTTPAVRDQAGVVLRRVAEQWRARPPTFPAWHGQSPEIQRGFREVQACLANAGAEGATPPRP